MTAPKQGEKESPRIAPHKDVQQSSTRAEPEAGGLKLEQDQNVMSEQLTAIAAKRRRRPKKIADKVEETSKDTTDPEPTLPTDITVEMNVLKSRVQEIEAQVQEILVRSTLQAPTKSARRRTRHKKISALGDVAEPDDQLEGNTDRSIEDSTIELQRLQSELQVAREELVTLKQEKSKKLASGMRELDSSAQADDEDDTEDVPRTRIPELIQVQRPHPLGRSVTLTGAYRLPLPVNLSDAELDAIGKGIKSAQSIARSFMNASAGSKRPPARPERGRSAAESSGSWSEWIGGYSISIAKAVDNMHPSSSMETVPLRPKIAPKPETAPPTRRKPQKLEMRNTDRSNMPRVSRRLSDQQVEGLLA